VGGGNNRGNPATCLRNLLDKEVPEKKEGINGKGKLFIIRAEREAPRKKNRKEAVLF